MDDARAAIAAVFDRAAAAYDSVGVEFFSTFGRQLVDDLDIRQGERVVDIGCGRGAVAFPAAQRVGATGSVTAIDLAPAMVERTAAEARDRELANVHVEVMDAQEPLLPHASYDVVASSLVIFFLPDPLAALRSWRALLVEKGRLGFTTFAGDDKRWSWLDEVFGEFAPQGMRPPASTDPKNPFRSDESTAHLVRLAGFCSPRSAQRVHETTFDDEQSWHDWSWSHGQRGMWERVPPERREEVRQRAFTHLRAMRTEHGAITLRSPVRYTLAGR